MKINATIMKEKSITVNQLVPSPKMHINMSRLNMMPNSPKGKNLQCELKLSLSIEEEGDGNKVLACINLSYVIIAELEDIDDDYEQTKYADKLFTALQPMYVSEANFLLRESPFPPMPLNVKC
ncbi:MAG: hypothetical protein IJU95_03995 [Treponema sp.]|nr:hypothetical protein [Treponema sp.]